MLQVARWLLLAGAGLCGSAAAATDTNLVASSPFLPPGWGDKPATTATRPPPVAPAISRQLEFRGLIEINGVTRFSIFDKKENEGYWLELNETSGGFEILRYDDLRKSILISTGGSTEEIAMASPDDSPMQISNSISPSVKAVTSPATMVRQASTSSTGRKSGPIIPRRRLIRSNNDSNTANQTGQQEPPANPVPPPGR
ncbi:hypothetical protein [Ruficoccus sp. ZRK36]|uniref:hypothetical protein n=1 Tax=Ruficoccus sp. ZRK36 TaxID=2866311 RepID=UPI001C73ABE7|nr:hypothetical protein [Ruficoccus sp. ZRK36]QYY35253.1 hypothetical protein K0V07_13240 [Ruficoccus sp. ZRK36]